MFAKIFVYVLAISLFSSLFFVAETTPVLGTLRDMKNLRKKLMILLFFYWCSYLDHNDPSKPSHRLTNGPEPSKTIESDGGNIKKTS